MKIKFISLVAVLCTLFSLSISANAITLVAGFEVESLSEEDEVVTFANVKMTLLSTEVIGKPIACFDVSSNGLIAVGFDSDPKTINVYDESGNFLYGYQFKCEGTYGISFEGDNLAVYFCRGELVQLYDSQGQGIRAYRVLRTQNNQEQEHALIYPMEKWVNNTHYSLERDFGILMRSYSRLVSRGQNIETIIYDVTPSYNILTIFGVVFFAVFFIFIIYKAFQQEIQKEEHGC